MLSLGKIFIKKSCKEDFQRLKSSLMVNLNASKKAHQNLCSQLKVNLNNK